MTMKMISLGLLMALFSGTAHAQVIRRSPALDLDASLMDAIKARKSNLEIESLISHGAHINGSKDMPGAPIVVAAWGLKNGGDRIVKLLVDHHANLNLSYGGDTPLREAVMNCNFSMTKLLLSAGANPNFSPGGGWLHDDAVDVARRVSCSSEMVKLMKPYSQGVFKDALNKAQNGLAYSGFVVVLAGEVGMALSHRLGQTLSSSFDKFSSSLDKPRENYIRAGIESDRLNGEAALRASGGK